MGVFPWHYLIILGERYYFTTVFVKKNWIFFVC